MDKVVLFQETTVQYLTKAKERINTKDKWIKECLAQDINGKRTDHRSNDAYSFCIIGTLLNKYDYGNKNHSIGYNYMIDTIISYNFSSLVDFNNSPHITHEDIMKTFDVAIEKSYNS